MTDPLERELKDLLDERARGDPLAPELLADGIATLPPRRRRFIGNALLLAAAVVLLTVLVAVAAPRLGGVGGEATSATPTDVATHGPTLPGGPEAFTDDPRLQECSFGPPSSMEYVFEMVHARDYQRYLPSMLLSPELDVDEPALVVVFVEDMSPPPMTGAFGAGPPATNQPGHRYVCVTTADAGRNLYADVNITGLTIDVTPGDVAPTPMLPATVDPDATPTPPPAPAWVADLAGQLDCVGSVASIGGEVPDAFGVGVPGDTADTGLHSFLGPGNPFASLPAAGYTQIHLDDHWASYAHEYEGRARAIIVLTDTSEFQREPGWIVVGLRACDASEFDPSVPLTFPVTIWTDAAGAPVSTETIRSSPGPGHCGWDSATWLSVGGNLYFRDPQGVMSEFTMTSFEPKVHLPDGAVDTGYRTGAWSLWLEQGGDAYLVSSDTIERWPRSTMPELGCV